MIYKVQSITRLCVKLFYIKLAQNYAHKSPMNY